MEEHSANVAYLLSSPVSQASALRGVPQPSCVPGEEARMLAQRVPSGNLLHSLFDDEFDAVMAAAMEADPTAWKLEAAAPPVTSAKAPAQAAPVQATAANVRACVVAPSAAPRCVDATHASPCPWCVPHPAGPPPWP